VPLLRDYLDMDLVAATSQWHALQGRQQPPRGKRQVSFTPLETLLCLFASFVVNHSAYGGGNARQAPSPVPELASLFRRPASSVLIKMANLDGTWRNGAANDLRVGNAVRAHPELAADLYRVVLASARQARISSMALPDFLGIESGGSYELLGQEELSRVDLQSALEPLIESWLQNRADLSG
jgi:putative restriction endonuclease